MKKTPFISFIDVNKVYPNGVHAVIDFNLDVYRHEFIVLVGPSGCGKSTTLRMLAGLEDITRGTLFINGEIANSLTPKERDLAMVFQSYALYPHMSVYNNLAFGLKMRKYEEVITDEQGEVVKALASDKIKEITKIIKILTKRQARLVNKREKFENAEKTDHDNYVHLVKLIKDYDYALDTYKNELSYYEKTPIPLLKRRKYTKEEIDEKVRNAAAVLDIENYLHAKPRELSGGQRQRVALGRSIVRNTDLFLMDEPLSNLDAKLRIVMRSEIVALHRRLKSTTIYVTHDQTEAMTMADRIVVMKDGLIMQVGSPQEIYEKPANLFTASFIGSPEMNLFLVSATNETITFSSGEKLENSDANKTYARYLLKKVKTSKEQLNQELVEHYEAVYKKKTRTLHLGIRPEDISVSKTKKVNTIKALINNIELLGKEYYIHFTLSNKPLVAIINNNHNFKVGEEVYLTFPREKLYFFDERSEENIR